MSGDDVAEALFIRVVPAPDAFADESVELSGSLRDDLLDLDVADVEPLPVGEAPEGSKGVVTAVGGWLAVKLGPEVLRRVVQRAAAWAGVNARTVEITIGGDVLKLTGVDDEQQRRLIDEWLARTAASA